MFLDVEQDLSARPGPGGRHPLPDPLEFARAAGAAGIGPGVFVVAYGSLGGAERLWWLLRHFGHDTCGVIDLASWHGPLSSGGEQAEPELFEPHPRADDTIDRHELAARRDELVVVDSRLPSRYRGEENPIDRVPGTDSRRPQRSLERAPAGAAARRARRVLRLGHHRLRDPAPAPARRPPRTPVSGLVVRMDASEPVRD